MLASLTVQLIKNPPANVRDPGSIPGSGRSAAEGIGYPLQYSWDSLMEQLVKNPPTMRETWIQSLRWEDPWRRDWLSTPVFWPGVFHGLQSMGLQRVGHDWSTFSFTFMLYVTGDACFHLRDTDASVSVTSLFLTTFQGTKKEQLLNSFHFRCEDPGTLIRMLCPIDLSYWYIPSAHQSLTSMTWHSMSTITTISEISRFISTHVVTHCSPSAWNTSLLLNWDASLPNTAYLIHLLDLVKFINENFL